MKYKYITIEREIIEAVANDQNYSSKAQTGWPP